MTLHLSRVKEAWRETVTIVPARRSNFYRPYNTVSVVYTTNMGRIYN